MDRLMQWAALIGGGAILAGQYVANLPYAVYPKSNFWTDNPSLIVIRVGIALLLLAGSYMWTAWCAGTGWSWMECMGRNSLLVYWVHTTLVYGPLTAALQKALSIPATALAVIAVTAVMAGLAALWEWWKRRRAVAKPVSLNAASSQLPTNSTAPSRPRT